MTRPAHVVLVGGGYVTVWAGRALRRWGGRRVEVTIVAPVPVHVFHGWTGEIVAGDLPAAAGLTPLAEACPGATVVPGWVMAVDRADRRLEVRTVEGAVRTITYDHLVVGTGTGDRTDVVPGLAEHALTVRGPDDVPQLVAAVDAARGRVDAPAVVVAGGGLAGVELTAALASRLGRSPVGDASAPGGGTVTLVQRGPAVGADLAADHPTLAYRISADLARLGVRVLVGTSLVGMRPGVVDLDDGTTLAADVVVAACGTRAAPLPGLADLPTDPLGRLVVDDRLRVAPRVWAGGDAACVPFIRGGACPASALWAITHGTRIGRSIARATLGLPPARYRFPGIGRAASLGPGRGVAELAGVPMAGWVAWVVRLLFFLRYAPSGAQQRRVLRWWWQRWRRGPWDAVPDAARQPRRDPRSLRSA
jgi:NADH dehydrogenase